MSDLYLEGYMQEEYIYHKDPEPLPEIQKVFLKCMENFIREREQEAVKRFWRELKMCLDLPITKESAVIVLDKNKVDEVLKKYGG